MQKILRALIIIAMLITAYLLLLAWQKDYANKPQTAETQTTTVSSQSAGDLPSAKSNGDIPTVASSADTSSIDAKSVAEDNLINVSTDMYNIKINPTGGDVVYASLKKYDATMKNKKPFVLLENNNKRVYVAQSGLVGQDGIDTNDVRAEYEHTSNNYVMADGQDVLSVPLTYEQNGVTITKTYTFSRGKYPIEMSYNINNPTDKSWQGQLFAQLKRDESKDPGMEDKGPLSMATFLGGAWGTPESDYNKLKFDEFNDGELKATSQAGWVAMVQHYFVSAWTPKNFSGQFFSRENNKNYLIGFTSQPISVPANKQKTLSATLYTGPKVQKDLKTVAQGLNKTVDYGVLWPISKVMFAVLQTLHQFLGNWGWSIIFLTIIVKIALLWISNKSYYSMAKMRAIAPQLEKIKEEHGDDRMKLSQEMMALYKREQVNPMAGCFPMLLQMPIFLGLYWVLVESIELRHAPWMFWIQDLSAMDPYFILPALMGASMYLQQSFNPQPTDPTQAKVMKFMPIMFTGMMMFFPAGLVLYWTVNNIFSMSQQYYINKKVEKMYQAKAEKTA
ncbi:MAG: membrane protein insertase YidC [Moraxellaceae bacterium]|nr:membrane protein insertase YidC [Moraxellaceae bacterium]